MDTCTKPVDLKNGKYVLCGRPAIFVVGSWKVCPRCKPIADYYARKYAVEEDLDERKCIRTHTQ